MTSGYILVLAILVLGGVIATVGDRLGSRVGKARLSLFNLRPRQTAVLITILTGSLVSASTLGVLLAIDGQLRTGVFELGKIQTNLKDAREELDQVRTQKQAIGEQLSKSRSDQLTAQRRLDATNRSLDAAIARQAKTQGELQRRITDFEQARTQLETVTRQALSLRLDITQLQNDRQQLLEQRDVVRNQIAQRDRELSQRNQDIAQRDRDIARRSQRLKELEFEQTELEKYLRLLENQIRLIRDGRVAVVRGQVLAFGVLRIVDPSAAIQAVDQLLIQANRVALQLTQPGVTPRNNQVVIRITNAEVEQLIEQIQDGQDYVVQVLSASNFVLGEKEIKVIASATLNRLIFPAGEIVASSRVDSLAMSEDELRQRLELLLAGAEFRAQGLGVLAGGIQVGSSPAIPTIVKFTTDLQQFTQPVDLQIVTADNVYTAGPLKVQIIALQNGKIVLQTE